MSTIAMGTIILVRKKKMKITLFVIFSVKSTCHYTQENLDFLEDEPINTVPKNLNPPNAPQIQPI